MLAGISGFFFYSSWFTPFFCPLITSWGTDTYRERPFWFVLETPKQGGTLCRLKFYWSIHLQMFLFGSNFIFEILSIILSVFFNHYFIKVMEILRAGFMGPINLIVYCKWCHQTINGLHLEQLSLVGSFENLYLIFTQALTQLEMWMRWKSSLKPFSSLRP